jgi:hypothetical protein
MGGTFSLWPYSVVLFYWKRKENIKITERLEQDKKKGSESRKPEILTPSFKWAIVF